MSEELQPLMGSVTEVDLDTHFQIDNGDHERFSHYVHKDDVMESMVNGTPSVALCGKVWTPSRDGDKFPVCPTCKEIYLELPSQDGVAY
jgi:hypothetical protein